MRNLVAFLLILAGPLLADGNPSKMLRLQQTSAPIRIDGVIESGWLAADSVSDFIQQEPYHGRTPSRGTVAKLLTTDESLFCLIICLEDRQLVQTNTGKLDDQGGDIVSLMLDTFDDRRTAYKFAVSAGGVRNDCRLLDDARNRDYNWDGIWFSAARVYDWGFVIEMEIPYRSIQYDEKLAAWGLDFDRWIPARNEDIYWCAYEENEGQRISKFGKLLLENFRPGVKGLNVEIYPVGISKATYLREGKYKIEPDAGIDLFYNPSQKLTFQLTGNPDFAQIEADPFNFNITRYESYFDERRPFFTEGNEVFSASGRQRNTGFYRPLELFYSRRIGRKLPDGREVPLLLGAKAFGRIEEWEYGGFVAMTGEQDYLSGNAWTTEPRAYFGSARLKKQIFDNSSIGVLFVGKHSAGDDNGVLDIDGALRTSDWQLAYQVARSFSGPGGDVAASAGFTWFRDDMMLLARGRYIGGEFDVDQVGFVPWRGTGELVVIGGPRWYYPQGELKQFMIYGGGAFGYKEAERYTDHIAVLAVNVQFRSNWGSELTASVGRSKDAGVEYPSSEYNYSFWFNTSPRWNLSFWGGYSKTYNFSRNFLAFYSWFGSDVAWRPFDILGVGGSLNLFVEGNPQGDIEDITYNARPYFSITPVNDLNIRMYVDNVFIRSTDRLEQMIVGLLFSYNFLPKSWIYLAINEIRDRSREYDAAGTLLPNRFHVRERAGVFKLKYLYYF